MPPEVSEDPSVALVPIPHTLSSSVMDGPGRILSSGHTNPAWLIVDPDAAYFVVLGERMGIVANFARSGCCSIWRAPR